MRTDTPLPEGWDEGTVESNGVRLRYVRTGGDGPPLVIAHGVFDDGLSRLPLVRELEPDYDVVTYDARGHGRSDAPEEGYAPEDRATDLLGLIEALDLDRPVLLGHSMGGDTVAAAAARRPDLPRAVVLVDPASMLAGEGDDGEREGADEEGADEEGDDGDREARADDARERIEWWHERPKEELLRDDDELRGHVEAGDVELAELLADARLRVSPNVAAVFRAGFVDPAEAFPRIEAPTLILRAAVDESRRERERDLAEGLADGRLVHVDGAGHTVFRDEREAATRELRAFLDGA